ncbi:hypothetical protein SSP24_13540 [Streptomyces spinoverrucosus]|uniref:Uncharacterized protein n=1 Tax=Streptomyces spinoverrucosus TaxID=284043 RepID=A0A4Y3VDD8_9ACTN|nr:hypothetical protein SSP24_13540 [Streptomyces spinoverrucosus]GHB50782.1 hypothetical protein GCM10010397_21130 [Streptomyces spinoverrucosus]
MVRRSQTSNPRSTVVLTSGADWGTRAARQRRGSGAEFPMPRRQAAKLKALQLTLGLIRTAINAKRWAQARYMLSRARALVNALPADQTVQEREQLSLLRKKFEARGTPAAKKAAKAKAINGARAGGKKSAAKPAPSKAAPKPTPDLGDRHINRAALGYTSEAPDTNLTKGAQPSRPTAKGGRARSLESRTWMACSVTATSTQSSPELPL